MQNCKRVLALALALILTCANLPWTAAAAELAEVTEATEVMQPIEATQPDETAQPTDKSVSLEDLKEEEATATDVPAATGVSDEYTYEVTLQVPEIQVGDPVPALNEIPITVEGGTLKEIRAFDTDGDTVFQERKYYTLFITVSAPEGKLYHEDVYVYCDIPTSWSRSEDGTELNLNVTYNTYPPKVEELQIAGIPTAIEAGAVPAVDGLSAEGNAQITGTRWVNADYEAVDAFVEGNDYYLEIALAPGSGYEFRDYLSVYDKATDDHLETTIVDGNTAKVYRAYSLKPDAGPVHIEITGFEPGAPVEQMNLNVTGHATVNYYYIEDRDTREHMETGNFEKEKQYFFSIYFDPAEGYAFFQDTEVTVSGGDGVESWQKYVFSLNELNIDVYYDFCSPRAEDLDFSGMPDTIEAGTVPAVDGLSVEGGARITNVSWVDTDKQPVTEFVVGKGYYLQATLAPEDGYVFRDWVSVNADDYSIVSANELTVYWYYSLMPDVGPIAVEITGATVGASVDQIGVQITGNAKFVSAQIYDTTDGWTLMQSGSFETDHTYRVEVELEANTGYEFVEYPEVTIVDGSGGLYSYGRNTITAVAYYDFRAPAAEELYINGAPRQIEAGAVPTLDLTVDGDAEITNTRWLNADGQAVTTLAEGGKYTLELTLAPTDGFVFRDYVYIAYDYNDFDDTGRYPNDTIIVSENELTVRYEYSLLPDAGRVDLTVSGVEPGAPVSGFTYNVTGNAKVDSFYISYSEGEVTEGNFEEDYQYQVGILLYPAEGYRFTDENRPFVNGTQDYGWNDAEDGSYIWVYIYYDFRKPAVEHIGVEGMPDRFELTAGAAQLPELSIEEGEAQITDIRWLSSDKEPVTAFETGKDYYLQVTYAPNEGYAFRDYVNAEFDYRDDDYEIVEENQLVAWYYYSLKPEVGTVKLEVTGLAVGKPVGAVQASVDGKAVLNGLYVYDQDAGWESVESGNFESNKIYSVSVSLLPADGYRFGDNTRVYVNGKETYNFDYSSIHLDTSIRFVTYKKISTVALTVGKVAAGNKISSTKVTVPSGANYTVSYKWYDITDDHNPDTEDHNEATGKFQSGHKYYVYFTVTAKDGYVFDEDMTITVGGKKFNNWYGGNFRIYGEQTHSLLKKVSKVEFSAAMTSTLNKGDTLPNTFKFDKKTGYTVSAYWNLPDGADPDAQTATHDGTYMLIFEAIPAVGYEFDEDVTVYVGGKKYTQVMSSTEYVDAYKIFNIGVEEIHRIDLTVEKPVEGEKPAEAALADGTKAVIWHQYWMSSDNSDGSDNAAYASVFKEGKYHFLTFVLQPDSGYALADDVAIYVNGRKASLSVMYNLGTYCQTAVSFGKLGEAKPMKAPTVKISQDGATGQQVLTWEANPDATGYEVYRATSKSGKYSLIATITDTTYMDEGNAVGKTRYYKVKAVDADNTKKNSGYSKVVSKAAKCAQPTGTAVQIEEKSGKPALTWDAVAGAKKYEVYRATVTANGTSKYSKVGTATKTTYTDTSAKVGTEYSYRIYAVPSSSSYKSAAGEAVNAIPVCAAPVVTVKLDAATGKPALSWKKVDGAQSYQVYRASEGTDGFEPLPVKDGVTYLDETATVNVTYSYKVQAIGKTESLDSILSDVVEATCGLARPVVTITADDDGKPVITWEAIEGAVTYKVLRSSKASDSMKYYTELPYEDGTSFTDTTVGGGKTYYYKVIAVGEGVESAATAYKKATGKCARPVLTAEPGTSGKPSLKWNKISGAKKYEIRYSTDGGETWAKKTITTTKTSYTHSAATNGKQYTYQVRALGSKSAYNGLYSESASSNVTCGAPSVTVTVDKATGQLNLSWKKVTGAAGYAIYRAVDGVAEAEPIMVTSAGYKDTDVVPGVLYSYQVVTCGTDSVFNSIMSKAVSATATTARPAIAVTANEAGKPVISWEAVDGAHTYVLYRSTKSTKSYKVLVTLDKESCSYTDTTVSTGKSYYYKVIAVTENGTKSDYSAYKKATGKCAQPVAGIDINAKSGKPVVSWAKVSGAKKYDVYRATVTADDISNYSKLGTTTKLSYTDTKASVGKTYSYKVVAVGSKSAYNSLQSEATEPVTALMAQPAMKLSIDSKTGKPVVSWGKVSGTTKYSVMYVDVTDFMESEEGPDETYVEENMQYVEVEATKTSVTLTDTEIGHVYLVTMTAVPENEECYSVPVDAQVVASACAAPKITGFIDDVSGKPGAYGEEVDGAVRYYVYRSTKKSSGYECLGYVDDAYFVDYSAKKGKTYYYKLTAVAGYSESNFSNYVKLKSK